MTCASTTRPHTVTCASTSLPSRSSCHVVHVRRMNYEKNMNRERVALATTMCRGRVDKLLTMRVVSYIKEELVHRPPFD